MNLLSVLLSLLLNYTYLLNICTKQTPRNPKIDRPTAARGSDIQLERRVPSKPMSKKVAMNGGKQPRKHLLHKLIR